MNGDFIVRSFRLDDIEIDRGGRGRTVTAYAAVFNEEAEINDKFGHYMEAIDQAAFNRTLQHNGLRVGVFYNHGMTLHGTPSDLGSVSLGSPQEIKADNHGLLTRTKYNNTPLADLILESINNGDVMGYSFTGRVIRSDPKRMPRQRPGSPLPIVRRLELGLQEYGPTPLPSYDGAMITAVRAMLTGTPQSTGDPSVSDPHTRQDAGPGAEDSDSESVHSGRLSDSLRRVRAARMHARMAEDERQTFGVP